MPKYDLSVEKLVFTTFSKLLHFQSWAELASHPKSQCQHVLYSLGFSSRQSQCSLLALKLNSADTEGVSAILIQIISGTQKMKAGVPVLKNIDWCNMGKERPKKQKTLSYVFYISSSHRKTDSYQNLLQLSRREAWSCIFRGGKHSYKKILIPDVKCKKKLHQYLAFSGCLYITVLVFQTVKCLRVTQLAWFQNVIDTWLFGTSLSHYTM